MQIPVQYDKKKTIQALRFHFIARNEVRVLVVMINIFAIASAVLFYTKKIRPEYFLLGSVLWIVIMLAVWFLMPSSVYKRTEMFQQQFIATLNNQELIFETEKGVAQWQWKQFEKYIETPHFFHLYFNAKSFILLPKEDMGIEAQHEVRGILRKNING